MLHRIEAGGAHAPPALTPPQREREGLFMGGPTQEVQARLGLAAPGQVLVARRVAVFLLFTWVPLLVLTAIEGTLWDNGKSTGLLVDYGAWARYVVAAPLMIAAEAMAGRMLGGIVERFEELIPAADPECARFAQIVGGLRRLRDLPHAAVAMTMLAYVISISMARAFPLETLAGWQRTSSEPMLLSLAGWWVVVVSLPLLLLLVLSWVWRLVLWTRFLLLVSRLDLHLVPAHPDKAASIGFVGHSLRGFALLAAAIGALVAGSVANDVMHAGATLADMRYRIAGVVVFCIVLFTAPLLAFAPLLQREWRRGVHHYDNLARDLGREFDLQWLTRRAARGAAMLEKPDYSAAADLYSVVDRIHDLRWIPVDLSSLAVLAVASLLPFVPVVFMAVPTDVVVSTLTSLLR
jgi:hypothetical protein